MPAAQPPAGSIRARVRAEMIDEIKVAARRHLAADGANLSLRAVARDMGMVSSAIYRYFPSRDELLTALIIDAYNSLGDAVEAADALVTDRADLRGRWFAVGRAIRRWALSQPSEYALIFGSPVPGYAAPQDTITAAARAPLTLLRIVAAARPDPRIDPSAAVVRDLEAVASTLDVEISTASLAAGSMAWIHIFGAISFELFGQLNNVIEARAEYFDMQLSLMADLVGLATGDTPDAL
jgi:AcrR family transcriptional regulator